MVIIGHRSSKSTFGANTDAHDVCTMDVQLMRPLASCTYNRSTAPLARSARACKAHLQSGERILISIEETNVITCFVDICVFCCCWCCPYKLECLCWC